MIKFPYKRFNIFGFVRYGFDAKKQSPDCILQLAEN